MKNFYSIWETASFFFLIAYLLAYLLNITNSEIEYEDFNSWEINKLNSLSWAKSLDNAIKSLKI